MGKRWVARSALVALLGCVFVACGGQSENEGEGSESGGGGNGSGGGGGSGGSSAVGGSGGSGGGDEICSLPPDAGPCEAYIRLYAFDPQTGLCLPFIYGGCEGNANSFESAEACYGTCGGQGAIDPTTCERPADCLLVPTTCCGDCSPPTAWNRVAIGNEHEIAVQMAMGCHLVDCPPCDAPAPNPWLFAACSAGRCITKNALETELTECAQASDCRLRGGLACCEACNPESAEVVSVNASVDLEPWLCGDSPDDCDACVPAEPMYLDPTCDDNMRCGVARASPPID